MIRVRKRNEHGQVVWEYSGVMLEHGEDFILLEARFDREDMPFQDIILKKGDLFVETFYTDRWYNIFEIHDRDDHSLKGWYCNVSRPVVWDEENVISYEDLALDLWVTPNGLQHVLDEHEFNAANLDELTRDTALKALAELQNRFKTKQPGLV